MLPHKRVEIISRLIIKKGANKLLTYRIGGHFWRRSAHHASSGPNSLGGGGRTIPPPPASSVRRPWYLFLKRQSSSLGHQYACCMALILEYIIHRAAKCRPRIRRPFSVNKPVSFWSVSVVRSWDKGFEDCLMLNQDEDTKIMNTAPELSWEWIGPLKSNKERCANGLHEGLRIPTSRVDNVGCMLAALTNRPVCSRNGKVRSMHDAARGCGANLRPRGPLNL